MDGDREVTVNFADNIDITVSGNENTGAVYDTTIHIKGDLTVAAWYGVIDLALGMYGKTLEQVAKQKDDENGQG